MGFMGGLVFSAKILDQQEYDKATLQKFSLLLQNEFNQGKLGYFFSFSGRLLLNSKKQR